MRAALGREARARSTPELLRKPAPAKIAEKVNECSLFRRIRLIRNIS